jgi:thiol-disulfide isomerase/thioredoxin
MRAWLFLPLWTLAACAGPSAEGPGPADAPAPAAEARPAGASRLAGVTLRRLPPAGAMGGHGTPAAPPAATLPVDATVLERDSATLLLVLSPECPLCLDYAHTFRQLAERCAAEGVRVRGVFPGTFFPDAQIRHYLTRFRLDFPAWVDADYALTRALGADTTPEALLLDARGRTVYQGAIDNWAVEVARKRLQPTRHWLADALTALSEGRAPDPDRTPAVGCLIE